MATVSVRIDAKLTAQAEQEARIEHRSTAKQIEYWARLGKAVASRLHLSDAIAITQGLKEIRLESTSQEPSSAPVSTDDVFNDLEQSRQTGTLPHQVTSAKFYFEASIARDGFLDRVDAVTGRRETGQFADGIFRPSR